MYFLISKGILFVTLLTQLGFKYSDCHPTDVLTVDVSHDKQVICEAKDTADEDKKVSIRSFMEYDDLLKLIVWNHKFDLKSDNHKFTFRAEVNWKRDIVERLANIFITRCPAPYVPPGFIHIAKELFMIYLNSVENATDHSTAWKSFNPVFDLCKLDLIPFEISPLGDGNMAGQVKIATKDGEMEDTTVLSPTEYADGAQDMDLIIDTMWWLFSFSFGTCYWRATIPSNWAPRFKRLFYADFLSDLRDRWLHAGPETDFGVIFGDFDIKTIMFNIRFCVTAAYVQNGLADRQLVRSMPLTPSELGIDAGINKKLGSSI